RAREEDVLSGFVSPRFDPDPDHGAAAPPISTPAPSISTPPRGTPIELMERALQNWTGAGKERAKVEAALDKGRPLEAEDPERLRKYARRQIELLGRATVHEAPELRDPLRESLREVSSIMAAEAATPDSALALERVIGQAEEFFSVMFMKRATMVLRSVGRIIERRGQRRGFGTGFLIAPGVLMTNHHVLDTAFAAENASVQFHYELDVDRSELSGHIFHLRPDLLFEADKALDFAVVAVEPTALDSTPLATFGHLPLVEAIGKIRVGQNVNIIQHPEGDRKQVVFRESVLKVLPKNPDTVAHYTGDTKPGSSGSPVFSDNWEVVALHHSGVPATDADGNWLMRNNKPFRRGDDVDEIKWIANEGIRISRIVARLKLMHEQEMGPAGRPGRALLGEVLSVGERARKLGPFYTPPGMERAPATVPEPPRPRPTPAPVPAMQETADPYEAAESAPMPSEETAPTVTAPGGSISVTLPLTVTLGFGSADGAVATMPAPVPGPALHLHRGPGAPAPDTQESRRRPEDYDDRTGFDRDFLGPRVEMPTAGPALRASIATLTGSSETELRYDHFSVLMHRDRRLAAVAAGNFRTDAPFKASRRDPWGFDPRLPRAVQLGNDAYRNNDLDRGHLFRRADGAWGESAAEARRASDDTFHWTNIAPQHKVFNQSGEDPNLSVWGLLENHLVRETEAESRRMSVFNGPIFADHDPLHRGVAVPQAFWKLAVVRGRDGALRAFAFVLGQQSLLADLPAEAFDAGRFAVFQVQIREIESRTGLDFGALQQADVLVRPGAAESFGAGLAGRRITDLAEIVKD
ncbi:MAG: DNA/RNA non-specific endonuclease, partial [Pseudomonadota bacterium]